MKQGTHESLDTVSQNLIIPSVITSSFLLHWLHTSDQHLTTTASSLRLNYFCVGIRSHWSEVIKSNCPLVLLAQKVEGVLFGRATGHIPVPHRAIVLTPGCPEGWWERREGAAHNTESPWRQYAIWAHLLLISRAALVQCYDIEQNRCFNRVLVYFEKLWYLLLLG